VEPLYRDRGLDTVTSFMLDDRFTYEILWDGVINGEITMTVKSLADGTFYMDSGKGKLYFGKHEDTFYIYSIEGDDENLGNIFLSLPRLPLAYKEGLKWEDRVPIDIFVKGIRKEILQFLGAFNGDIIRCRGKYTFINRNTIEGTVTSKVLNREKKIRVVMDENVGFSSITAGNYELRRIRNEKVRS